MTQRKRRLELLYYALYFGVVLSVTTVIGSVVVDAQYRAIMIEFGNLPAWPLSLLNLVFLVSISCTIITGVGFLILTYKLDKSKRGPGEQL